MGILFKFWWIDVSDVILNIYVIIGISFLINCVGFCLNNYKLDNIYRGIINGLLVIGFVK